MVKKILKKRKLPTIQSFIDAQKYAERLGADIMDTLPDEITEEVAEDTLIPMLSDAAKKVIRAAMLAQLITDKNAGVGLAALSPEFNARLVAELIIDEIAEGGQTRSLIDKNLIGIVDDTVRINAEAREELGLKTHVIRTYSDVGLRNGTKYSEDCEWCLSRCGEWDSIEDAKRDGCFERHPGCLCEINYYYEKTVTSDYFRGFNRL